MAITRTRCPRYDEVQPWMFLHINYMLIFLCIQGSDVVCECNDETCCLQL
jgi:hypothetical protein